MLFRSVCLLTVLTLSSTALAEDSTTNVADAPSSTTPAVDEAPATTPPTETTGGNTTGDVATDAPQNVDGTATEGVDGTTTEAPAQEPAQQEPVQEETAQEPVMEKSPETDTESHSDAASHFTVEAMWNQSSGPVRAVLGTLLFMLVAAMGVGLERLITLQSARSQSRKVASEVGSLLKDGKMKDAIQVCGREDLSKSYLGHQLSAGLTEFAAREDHYGIEAVERALEKHAIVETASLNKGLNILATVGSTAPFVGLVGTIFGIINAFGQIGAEGGADLTTLAPAIGEALITTAFGIIVAIVGVWLFNYFTAVIGSIGNDMAESAQEIMDWCHKRILPESKSAK